jgi:hypothetical protein
MHFPVLTQSAYIPAQKKRRRSLFVTMDKKHCIETGWAFVQRGSTEKINRKIDAGNILPRSHPPIIEQENRRISHSSVDWTIPAGKREMPLQGDKSNRIHIGKAVKKHR